MCTPTLGGGRENRLHPTATGVLEFQFQKPTCEPQEDGPLKKKDDFSHFQEFPDILKHSNHNTLEGLISPIWWNTH